MIKTYDEVQNILSYEINALLVLTFTLFIWDWRVYLDKWYLKMRESKVTSSQSRNEFSTNFLRSLAKKIRKTVKPITQCEHFHLMTWNTTFPSRLFGMSDARLNRDCVYLEIQRHVDTPPWDPSARSSSTHRYQRSHKLWDFWTELPNISKFRFTSAQRYVLGLYINKVLGILWHKYANKSSRQWNHLSSDLNSTRKAL